MSPSQRRSTVLRDGPVPCTACGMLLDQETLCLTTQVLGQPRVPICNDCRIVLDRLRQPVNQGIDRVKDPDVEWWVGSSAKMKRLKELLPWRDGNWCFYCHEEFEVYTLDHYIPKSRGGEGVLANYRLACGPCNSRKRSHLVKNGQYCKRLGCDRSKGGIMRVFPDVMSYSRADSST